MTVKPLVGTVPAIPATPADDPSYLTRLTTKIGDILRNRWVIIAMIGLIAMGTTTLISLLASAVPLAQSVMSGLLVGIAASAVAWRLVPLTTKPLNVMTFNYGGAINDPWEWDADFGEFITDVKNDVNEAVIGKATGKKKPSAEEVDFDLKHGPTLNQVMHPNLWKAIRKLAVSNGFDMVNVDNVKGFIDKYGEAKFFYYMRNCHESFLELDKQLRIAAAKTKEGFGLGILSSAAPIPDTNPWKATLGLAKQLMNKETLKLAKGRALEQKKLDEDKPDVVAKIKKNYQDAHNAFQKCCAKIANSNSNDLTVFMNPEGEALFYILYQAWNYHMLAKKDGLIERVNQAKQEFATEILGRKAEVCARKFEKAKADIVTVQECTAEFAQAMKEHGFESTYYEIKDGEIVKDAKGKPKARSEVGSVVFWNRNTFKRKFELIPYAESDDKHKATGVILKERESGRYVGVKGIHGSANDVTVAMQQFEDGTDDFTEYAKKYPGLIKIIAGDLNPKSIAETEQILTKVDAKGWHATNVVVSTRKKRKVTPQHTKVDEEVEELKDFIMTPKGVQIRYQTVGWKRYRLPGTEKLPNKNIRSDHAPVGAEIVG